MTDEEPCARCVLIVDDDEDIREILRGFLEGQGFQVVLAAHGGEALAILDSVAPCLLLLDLVMPEMDGWEFLRQFEGNLSAQPPIYISTSAPDAAPPGYPLLPKPVSVLKVLDVVRQHCCSHHPADLVLGAK